MRQLCSERTASARKAQALREELETAKRCLAEERIRHEKVRIDSTDGAYLADLILRRFRETYSAPDQHISFHK